MITGFQPLWAAVTAPTADLPPLTAGAIVMQVTLIALFVLLNGFFVAAEFALVKVRTSQLDELIDDDGEPKGTVRRAQRARHILRNLTSYLSAAQLGITICSLVLGALAEPFVHRLVEPWLGPVGIGLPSPWVRAISWSTAILSVTALHVVIGEQMPKTLALYRPVGLTLWSAAPLAWFHWLFKPLNWLLNSASNSLLKWVFRIEPNNDHHNVHSAEELRLLVQQSEEKSEVTETERDILVNALELSERIVRDIMTPRAAIVALELSRDFSQNLQTALDSKHTRFPIIESHLESTLGMVHIKDLLAIVHQNPPDLRSIIRPLHAVPELMPLDKLLKFFLNKHAHLALVVDEFGGTIGMITLDDVLEELVGTIHDEFDTEDRAFQRLSEDEFFVDATLPLHELAELTELELESDDVSTVGGYVTEKVGHLPTLGETIEIEDDWLATVTRTDGHRVVQLQFRRATSENAAAGKKTS
ncbi:MAG: hemolysin family protein [Verrucomicrobiales bacterium]